ncbi:MAG: hypothetical protein Q9222_006896 [Ikaeria aurantiellina]
MSDQLCLSSEQAHALFDILTSHTTLTEIENLKRSQTIAGFGPPLQDSATENTSSPILQILLHSFILDLPGLRNVKSQFWTSNIDQLATALDDSNLSESYDKGSVGIRRTLSTVIASIVESVARGRLGGYPRQEPKQDAKYDKANPDDITRGWDDFLQRIIYGDLLEKMFVKAAMTDKLSDHEPVVQAAHQYAVIMFASLLHHNLIVSPRGQSMISLLNRVHRLMPYFLIKQTLKVGNAASMLNGMVQLLLAKMNLSTITSWFGGQASDSGMNLLQQIISQVLNAETTELRKRAKQIEQSTDPPSPAHLEKFRNYTSASSEEQSKTRAESVGHSVSIVTAILSQSQSKSELSELSHKLALDYVSIQLAIRDREKLIDTLCHHQPDLVTTSIREMVTVYDPIIRALHKAVDLSSGVTDLQAFLDDLIGLSLMDKTKQAKAPTVQDFCHLLEKHQGSSHVFIHQALKNGKELSEWYHEYALHAVEQYKQQETLEKTHGDGTAAGDFTKCLEELVANLSKDERCVVLEQVDHHATFLANIARHSKERMEGIVKASLNAGDPKTGANGAPGMFLMKWQCFINETVVTPGPGNGSIRTGKDSSVKNASAVDVEGDKPAISSHDASEKENALEMPDVGEVIRLLEPSFRKELQKLVEVRKGR